MLLYFDYNKANFHSFLTQTQYIHKTSKSHHHLYIVNCNLEPLLLFSLWGQPVHMRRTIINVVIHKQQFNVLLETNKVFLNEKLYNNHIRSLVEVSCPHIFKICDAQSVLIHESQMIYVNMWIHVLIGSYYQLYTSLKFLSCSLFWTSICFEISSTFLPRRAEKHKKEYFNFTSRIMTACVKNILISLTAVH